MATNGGQGFFQQQWCDHEYPPGTHCEVPCPASNVCPPAQLPCYPDQRCACGQDGHTVPCPDDGMCPR